MEVRVVGAHQTESAGLRATTFLVDGRLAIDAGNLASALSLDAQRGLEAVLLTHYHYDHVRDFPSVAFSRWGHRTLPVYCLPEVRKVLRASFFNASLWPDLEQIPSAEAPAIRFVPVAAYEPFEVADYRITPAPANHSVPAVGFLVERGGRSVFYTSDTHGGVTDLWQRIRPDFVLIEVTFPNRLDEVAIDAKHLTPRRLGIEIETMRSARGELPQIAAIHRNAEFDDEIAEELRALGDDLGASILFPQDGQRFQV
ncbi:MAG: MBL fold metallo-hydrolase [Dehalococcoidia bacterium]